MRQKAEQGESALPSWLTETERWNNESTLRGELAIQLMNVSDAQNIAFLFGNLGGPSVVGVIYAVAVRSIGRGVGVGFAAGAYGTAATFYGNNAQTQANAIQARLEYLKAQREGSCP